MAARPGTGPQAVRPGASGSTGAWSSQAGFAQSGTGQASYRPSGPQASYQPSGPQASYQPGGLAGRPQDSRESDSRQADRGADWGERTERIDRVNASGYPEPRGNSRSQGPGRPGPSRTSGPLGAPVAVGRGGVRRQGRRARGEGARGDGGWDDGGWGSADGTDRRAPGRDADRDNVRNSGGWPISARGGAPADRAGDEDPLTSRAYSRAAVSDADGRSYRVAARRSQAQAKLTEQATATFTATASYPSEGYRAGQYETGATEAYPAGQYQTGATGEYPAAQRPGRGDQRASDRAVPDRRVRPVSGRPAGAGRALPGLRQPARSVRPAEFALQPRPVVPADPAAATQGQPAASGQASAERISRTRPANRSERSGQPARPQRVRPAEPDPADRTGRARPAGQAARTRPHGQSAGNSGRVTLPTGSASHSGPYPTQPAPSAQQPRQPQHRTHSQPSRHAAPSQLPAGGSGRLRRRRRERRGSGSAPAAGARRAARRSGPRRCQRAEPVRVGGHGFLSVSQPALPVPRGSAARQRPPGSGEPRPGRPRRARRTRRPRRS